MVGGQPWRFGGYNLPCANSLNLSASQLQYYLEDIQRNSDANVVRVWLFQSEGGPGNWAGFDRVIQTIQAQGMRAIVTLTDEWNNCDEPHPAAPRKDLQWYQGGYQSPEGGYPLSFEQYATAVAARYAGNPAIAFWQLVNEPQAPTFVSGGFTCDEPAAMAALRSFADTTTQAIHRVDPHHLVDLGSQGIGACGMETGTDYAYVHAGSVDLCEYHDYGPPATAIPSELGQVIADCDALHKPTFVGEAGIPANISPSGTPASTCTPWPSCTPDPVTEATLEQRSAFFNVKVHAAAAAGVAGYVIWVDSPYYTTSLDGYAIDDPSDPTIVQHVLSGIVTPEASLAPPSQSAAVAPAGSASPRQDATGRSQAAAPVARSGGTGPSHSSSRSSVYLAIGGALLALLVVVVAAVLYRRKVHLARITEPSASEVEQSERPGIR
jgi:hypothetical protein